jgi:hypothetical protein
MEENRVHTKNGAAAVIGFTAPLSSLVLSAFIGLLTQPARADGDYFSPTDERVRLSLGFMHVSNATDLQANNATGMPGTYINGENQFGLDKSDFEPMFQATVRVDTRQRISIDYYTLDRSGDSIVTGTPIAFRDVTFLPGDPLQTQQSLRTLGLTYEYSFWHSETLEIAGTVGVHAADISTTAKVQTSTRHIIQTNDEAGPVPAVGIDATWVASKRFYFDGRAQYFSAHINNFDGSLGIYEFDALYRFRPNVSFGVGYTELKAHLAATEGQEAGRFDLTTKGPEVFVRVGF